MTSMSQSFLGTAVDAANQQNLKAILVLESVCFQGVYTRPTKPISAQDYVCACKCQQSRFFSCRHEIVRGYKIEYISCPLTSAVAAVCAHIIHHSDEFVTYNGKYWITYVTEKTKRSFSCVIASCATYAPESKLSSVPECTLLAQSLMSSKSTMLNSKRPTERQSVILNLNKNVFDDDLLQELDSRESAKKAQKKVQQVQKAKEKPKVFLPKPEPVSEIKAPKLQKFKPVAVSGRQQGSRVAVWDAINPIDSTARASKGGLRAFGHIIALYTKPEWKISEMFTNDIDRLNFVTNVDKAKGVADEVARAKVPVWRYGKIYLKQLSHEGTFKVGTPAYDMRVKIIEDLHKAVIACIPTNLVKKEQESVNINSFPQLTKVNTVARTTPKSVWGSKNLVAQMFSSTKDTIKKVEAIADMIPETIVKFDKFTDAVEGSLEKMDALILEMQPLIVTMNEGAQEMKPTMQDIQKVTQQATVTMKSSEEKFERVVKSIESVSDSVTGTLKAFTDQFTIIKEKISQNYGSLGLSLLSKISGLAIAIYAIMQAPSVKLRMLIVSSAALTLDLPNVIYSIVEMAPVVSDAVRMVNQDPSLSLDELQSQSLEVHAEALKSFFNCEKFFAVVRSALCHTLGIRDLDVPSIFGNAYRISQNIKGTTDIFKLVFNLLDAAYNWFQYGPDAPFAQRVKVWMDRIETQNAYLKDQVLMRPDLIKESKELLNEGTILLKELLDIKSKHGETPIVLVMFHQVQKYLDVLKTAAAIRDTRVQPVWLYMCGPSNVGKSFALRFLEEALYARVLSVSYDDRFMPSMAYTKNFKDKFWSGYFGQPFVEVNDAMQILTSENVDMIVQEFIDMINVSPYPLNMPDIDSKGNTYFNAKFVFDTENTFDLPVCNNVSNKRAYNRRQTYQIIVLPKKGTGKIFTKDGTEIPESDWNSKQIGGQMCVRDEKTMSAIREKTVKPWEVYSFCVFDPVSGDIIKADCDFTELVDMVALKYEANQRDRELLSTSAHDAFTKHKKPISPDTLLMCETQFEKAQKKWKIQGTEILAHTGTTMKVYSVSVAEFITAKARNLKEKVGRFTLPSLAGKQTFVVTADGSQELVAVQPKSYLNWEGFKASAMDMWQKGHGKAYAVTAAAVGGVLLAFGAFTLFSTLTSTSDIDRAESVSGNPKTTALKSKHVYRKPNSLVKQNLKAQSGDPQAIAIGLSLYRNIYHVCFFGKPGDDIACTSVATFLTERTFITTKHSASIGVLDENGQVCSAFHEVRFRNKFTEFTITMGDMEMYEMPDQDIIVCKILLSKIPLHKSILHHICDTNTAQKPTYTHALMLSITADGQPMMKIGAYKQNLKVIEYRLTTCGLDELLACSNIFQTEMPSVGGDCGSLYLQLNPSAQLKIIGIHVAGRDGSNVSMGTYIGDVKNHFMEAQAVSLQFTGSRLVEMGKAPIPGIIPMESTIRPSILQEYAMADGYKISTGPANLRPNENGSPLQKALSKFEGMIDLDLSLEEKDLLEMSAFETLAQVPCVFRPEDEKITLKEAINGKAGWKHFRKITMDTSAGIMVNNADCMISRPIHGKWTYIRCPTCNGKCVTNEHDLELTPEFQKYYDSFILHIESADMTREQLQEAFPVFFKGCLKDERVELQKILDNKTRLFNAGPLMLLLAKRQYLGALVENMMADPVGSISGMGINPSSVEWGALYDRFEKPGSGTLMRHFPGDFKFFDGSHRWGIVEPVLEAKQQWFRNNGIGKSDEFFRAVRNLELYTYQSYNIVSSQTYYVKGPNPSGDYETTAHNILVNRTAHSFSAVSAARAAGIKGAQGQYEPSDYTRQFEFQGFGDDHLESTGANWYSMQKKKQFMARLGLGYTNPDKTVITDETVPFYKGKDLRYLCREFVEEKNTGHILAPMAFEDIKEIVCWVRHEGKPDSEFYMTIMNASVEAAHHGPKKYTEFCVWVNQLLSKAGRSYVAFVPWQSVFRRFMDGTIPTSALGL